MLSREDFLKLVSAGENLTVEFKGEENRKISDDELIEAIVCLANAEGGYLFLGVEDDRCITGARPRGGTKVNVSGLPSMIYNKTRPNLHVDVQIIPHNSVEVVVIKIPDAITAVGTSSGLYKKRIIGADGKPACMPYFPHENISDLTATGRLDYTAASLNDLDENSLDTLEIERLFSIIRNNRNSDKSLLNVSSSDALKALGILRQIDDRDVPTIAGLLLLGKKNILNEYIPTHELAFQVFEGTDVSVNEFFKEPLLRTLETIWNYFAARNQIHSTRVGLFRVDIADYDEDAFREALNNAVLHRDYSGLGTVHIQWYEDRIQISNPGGFVRGVSPENILSVPPTPRNPLLADIFKRIGLVERSGRGVDLIFAGQLRNGRSLPDYSRSTSEMVTLNIPGGPVRTEFVQILKEHEDKHKNPLSFEPMLVLYAVHLHGSIETDKLKEVLQRGEDETQAFLQRLIDYGYVEKRDNLVIPSPLVTIKREKAVLEYIKTHGKIKRADVMDLCGINKDQAYRLLNKLKTKGKIIVAGSGSRTWYELSNKDDK